MKKIIFIADYFIEHVVGGGELNNEECIRILTKKGYHIKKIQSRFITLNFLESHKDNFIILSNFVEMPLECIEALVVLDYIIYEHDHKYLKSRNPATYANFKAPDNEIINHSLYKNAIAVLCQSKFHKEIVQKNLNIDNIINLGGNLWSEESLATIEQNLEIEKRDCCSVMQSNIPHKNTAEAVKYCNYKNIKYELIADNNYKEFLRKLGSNSKFMFLPKTPETLSRVVVEARMMGCSILTNNLVGAAGEEWFKLKGKPLIDFMTKKREEIIQVIENSYNCSPPPKKHPIVSMITTFHEGEQYLENFLHNITTQTIFDKCELILIDAASPGKEKQIVEKYIKKHKNIIYKRLDNKEEITPCLNLGAQLSNGKYITFSFIDDIKRKDCVEILLKNIIASPGIDLVYGDVLQTKVPNETFENNSSDGVLFDHSRYEFSKENMIKCLPGPMPLWKRSIHDRCGFFDTDSDYSDDWEMWLRSVRMGCKFKKVNEIVGLYYAGGRSFQTEAVRQRQRREEAELFYKYSELFGNNFNKFKPYFDQFVGPRQ